MVTKIKVKYTMKEITESVDNKVTDLNEKYLRMFPNAKVKFYKGGSVSVSVPKLSLTMLTEIHEDLRFLNECMETLFMRVELEI